MGNSPGPAIERELVIPCGILETVDVHLCRLEFYRHITTSDNVGKNRVYSATWKL
jgi:hypothetical protein